MHDDRRFRFEKIAKLDDERRKAAQPATALVEAIASFEPRVFLELGVGAGYFALPIAGALPEATIIGLDVEPRMLTVLTERAQTQGVADRLRVVEGQVDLRGGVGVDDDAVDVALMANLYHELDDRKAALTEARRVLRSGGKLVICDWDAGGSADFGPPLEHRVATDEVRRDLAAAGFREVVEVDLYKDFFTLIASP